MRNSILATSAANLPRPRGIIAARNEGNVPALINNLNTAFADFRQRNDARVDELTATVNAQQEALDALRLGGGSGLSVHPGAGLRQNGARFSPIGGPEAENFLNVIRDRPAASMTTQSDPDGGYTVYPQVDSMLEAVVRDLSAMRSLCRVVSMASGTGAWEKVVGRTGSQSAWIGEEDSRTDTDGPTLGKVTIMPEEVYALPELTNHLLEDSNFDLNSFLSEDVAAEFATVEGDAFINGNGIKKPTGFLQRPVSTDNDATRTFGTLQYTVSGHASGFITPTSSASPADCLHDLLTSLRPVYRKGAGVAWLMNSATANVVRKFKDGQGNYLWTNSLVAGQPDRLLGYPVAIDEAMPDIAADAFPIAFGDWQRGYAIVDKPGLRLIVDKLTKKGWTKMYFYKRVGGGVVDSNAIKLLKIST